jgi:tripartite-type tricarboxylate transporter receptor subunit TctC
MKRLQYSLAVALWLVSAGAHGESYPNKPVTLVVTAAPGGVTDILARVLRQRLGGAPTETACAGHTRNYTSANDHLIRSISTAVLDLR